MMVLVLEDDERRLRWLRRMLPRARIIWVRTVEQMVLVTQQQRVWDLVLLDHDLGQAQSGTEAARAIRVISPIVIWSLNPCGAERMVRILEEREQNIVGWFPFGTPDLVDVVRTIRTGAFGLVG